MASPKTLDRESFDRIPHGEVEPSSASSMAPRCQEVPHQSDRSIQDFEVGSLSNPRNWPLWRKWSIIAIIIPVDLSVSWAASGFSPASEKFMKDMQVSSELATLGLSMYVLGLAFGPMTLAPLSEYYGRSPVYITSYGIYLIFLMGTALVQNIGGFLLLRLLSGIFSSVTVANFGGTIADLFEPHDTGIPMSLFLWAATCGSPSGYFLFAFIAEARPWRDVFWALLAICGFFWLIMCCFLAETRHTIIQRRLAKSSTSRHSWISRSIPNTSGQEPSPSKLLQISLLRPFRFLFTEAIIVFGALFNGYLYGLSFLFNSAFSIVYGAKGHGFGIVGVGLTFLGIMVGITLGPITNLWQESYYQRRVKAHHGANIPETRVQLGKVAAVALPISLFWFAWTSSPNVHFMAPVAASALWGWSFYTLILMTYTYTEDSYKVFSASALAGLGLVRNIAGAGFPLFGTQMFDRLGSEWAVSLLAFLAVLMIPIPFILSRFGRALRLRSPWAIQHMDDVTDHRVTGEETP